MGRGAASGLPFHTSRLPGYPPSSGLLQKAQVHADPSQRRATQPCTHPETGHPSEWVPAGGPFSAARYAAAWPFASAASALNAEASRTARSARTFRSSATPAFRSPPINWL